MFGQTESFEPYIAFSHKLAVKRHLLFMHTSFAAAQKANNKLIAQKSTYFDCWLAKMWWLKGHLTPKVSHSKCHDNTSSLSARSTAMWKLKIFVVCLAFCLIKNE